MALAARDLGHEWLALTDHSPRLTVANGLSAERLEAQLTLVSELNAQLAPFRILTGIEVDILVCARLPAGLRARSSTRRSVRIIASSNGRLTDSAKLAETLVCGFDSR
jgi:hypothetical protein